MSLRVAVAHDYLTQRGGAERVALAICRAFPGARLHTSVFDPTATFPGFADVDVVTTPLQRLPAFRRDPRRALPLLAPAFARLHVDDVDVVVCSSSGWAHGIATDAPKLVYCHNPARWLYQPGDYEAGLAPPVRAALRAVRPALKGWDARAARSARRYLVNSTVVQRRVRDTYGLEADVLAPPIGLDPTREQEPSAGLEPGYFLVVGRPRGYKNVEVVCEAFRELPSERLVVVGGLPPTADPWPANLRGVTDVPDAELRWLYAHCAAVVAVAHEDFGLTPLEGNAFGRPALVLRAGGFLDTLVEGVTGHFVEAATPDAVRDAVRLHHDSELAQAPILEHAARYSPEAFTAALRLAAEQTAADRQ